ncbi:exodeoxyribonuclease VII large subunit [Nitrosovibrio sp. Nv17]|uniref:exodeoxyribonuclease VII large subunit n=1 Tax=Nitrosovibrio sp. Nv17 TaxID=1855339 RepID=UPI000931F5DA
MDPPVKMEHAFTILSVSELNRSVKDILERTFPLLWVRGEISNIKRYGSGHWYFSLKDAGSQVRCVMFREKSRYLDWAPQDGMQVEVRALVTLYQARGDFQLSVETIRRTGKGTLFETFELLKERLGREGLFDPGRKIPPPMFPRQIGIVTSPVAAALQDVLSTLRQRLPSVPVIVYPTPVQGAGAGMRIAAAIREAARRAECDVLILCRGGGSIEDLWAFNEEEVARAIAACTLPVICGVGHETDFTIADFVADLRAPTPTGASQLACPHRVELAHRVRMLYSRIGRETWRGIEDRLQGVDMLAARLGRPGARIDALSLHLGHLGERLENSSRRAMEARHWSLQDLGRRMGAIRPDIPRLADRLRDLALRLNRSAVARLATLVLGLERQQGSLAHLHPDSVLRRGYSIARAADGTVVRDSGQIDAGDILRVTFARGWSKASVVEKG